MVSLMTALYFGVLEAPDRVSVKPHASPVLHAINHLLGPPRPPLPDDAARVRRACSPTRAARRTRTRSTTAPGPSASAPPRRSGARSRTATSPGHFDVPRGGRQIALIGDAELDEGACWEAIADPMVARLGEVMWVVDLNRQSLDRVVPDIAAGRLAAMFEAAGWHTVMVKYGPLLQRRPTCWRAHRRDAQRGVPAAPARRRAELRERPRGRRRRPRDDELLATFRDLGGHDLASLIDGYRQADASATARRSSSPTRSRAGRCPTEGHPANHSALLNPEQYRELAAKLGEDPDDPWAGFAPGSPEAELCAATGRRLHRGATRAVPAPKSRPTSAASTPARSRPSRRSARFFVDLVREAPDVAERVVTSRPTSARRPTSAAGSTRRASGASATGSTGSPTTPTRSCAGASTITAVTSSWDRRDEPRRPAG
jgi:pyruvate dehydrogenase E1 component